MVAGEVDLATAPSLAQALQHVIGLGKGVVVDLEDVEFMDCSGLRALLKAVWRADQLPAVDLSVTPGPPQVQKLFELTGADQLVRFVPPTVVGIGAAA